MKSAPVLLWFITIMVVTADPYKAEASIIKLVCDYRWTKCMYRDEPGSCGEHDQIFVTVDTGKKLVDGRPAEINDDIISWLGPHGSGSINRKTGRYERHYETSTTVIYKEGECHVAPANKILMHWKTIMPKKLLLTLSLASAFLMTLAPRPEAAIIELVCEHRYVTCIGAEGLCGQSSERMVTVDTTTNMVYGFPASITDSDISWTRGGETDTINRKTGRYRSSYYENGKYIVAEGKCRVAPSNKF